MALNLFTVVIPLILAKEIPMLWRQCYPCLAYGNNYCGDNPNIINLKADRCYSEKSDKHTSCADFPFITNSMSCPQIEIFGWTDACDYVFADGYMQYYKVINRTITMPPRTTCGWFIKEYSGWLDIKHKYPISLYSRDYKTVAYYNVDYIVKKGDDGTDCLYNECRNYYSVTYGRKYFMLANWDRSKSHSVNFQAFDLSA